MKFSKCSKSILNLQIRVFKRRDLNHENKSVDNKFSSWNFDILVVFIGDNSFSVALLCGVVGFIGNALIGWNARRKM